MKKNLVTLLLCAFAFGLGFGMNNVAISNNVATTKVAYVNVAKLLSASKALKAAENEKAKQTQEMLKWYETASADIQQQKSESGRQSLIKKYEAQLTQKKNTIKGNYAKKINEIDAQLETVIAQKAKAMGYDLVFRSDSVIYGGKDITSSILPSVK